MPAHPTSYWDYVKIEELLSLQGGLPDRGAESDNDEVMFIVVHQMTSCGSSSPCASS